MAQALYRKWRPQTFDEVSGQEHVLHTLRNAISSGRIAHAYLFSGPRGTGKTTMARLLAKAVNCLNPDPAARPDNTCAICTAITEGRLLDLIELDAASNRGIDEIRDLRDKINFRAGAGSLQSLHHRRSAHADGTGVQRVAQDAGRAARACHLCSGHHRSAEGSRDDRFALPAVCLPAFDGSRDRRALAGAGCVLRVSLLNRKPSP